MRGVDVKCRRDLCAIIDRLSGATSGSSNKRFLVNAKFVNNDICILITRVL